MSVGWIHADKAESEVVSVRVDDKFGCAEDEENMSMQSHGVEKWLKYIFQRLGIGGMQLAECGFKFSEFLIK